ncbi:hypothetical protein SELMODRAFT_101862 [Selaginella moellendorffii]|uniref:Peptidase S54 rhomboid domain-containing protein n=1 Tax=Selaginella moellendorffii TaxID=88036 RepID=D8RTW4_SELML|nr:RHOMBOID-like protein 13 [Selaginella moellendorffii]EFJ24101.1 hypothetical protein SELMODRAFT_101862 [Selaginella moellendorffii]|eukprot:XP_002974581.1 RHOMBOID-like protein 13 [Selaginella moellendorffii]
MGRPLVYDIIDRPASSCLIALCSAVWLYIQHRSIGYAEVGMSYETVVLQGQYWRILTSSFSHISFLHLVFNMSALWSLGMVEGLKGIGLGVTFYVHYTLLLVLLSAALVLGIYHLLIHRFNLELYKRVSAVGYSCVVFGWMTILASKQPSSKLELFGLLSLPINFAPFESLVFTSIIVPKASFLGHLAGIIVGYLIAWGSIQGMTNYWFVSLLAWMVLLLGLSIHRTSSYQFWFLQIEPVADPSVPQLSNSPTLLQNSSFATAPPVFGSQLV